MDDQQHKHQTTPEELQRLIQGDKRRVEYYGVKLTDTTPEKSQCWKEFVKALQEKRKQSSQ